MKKYLSKKRVCAILISISMLISAIVMIPIPIEHVSAEDLYSAEEAAHYTDPIILPVGDDSGESVVIDTADTGTTYADTANIDTTDADTLNIDTTDTDTAQDDTGDIDDIDKNNTGSNVSDKSDTDTAHDDTTYTDTDDTSDIGDKDENKTGSNVGSNAGSNIDSNTCDSMYCEYCEDDTCMCEKDDDQHCGNCGEDACICNDDLNAELLEECEYCEGECTCDVVDLSMLRSEILIAINVNTQALLNRIIQGNLATGDAANFLGGANAATISVAISSGTPVIVQINAGITFNSAITVPGNRDITIISQDDSHRVLGMSANARHFIINTGAKLTLQNITLSAFGAPNPTGSTATRGGIAVSGGDLVMERDANIENNHYRAGTEGGGGVLVSAGSFTMNGGSITGNRSNPANGSNRGGGGVYVAAGSTFTMNGGLINNNYAVIGGTTNDVLTGGAGVYVRGTFYLNDGTISNNHAYPAPGVQQGGGGILVGTGGKMFIKTCLITKNICHHNSNEVWQGGGGILTAGEVTMKGGYIHDNTATWEGGGVFITPRGNFIMYEGEITLNKAQGATSGHGGGGILVMGGTFETKNHDPANPTRKYIADNISANNAGGISVRAVMVGTGAFNGPGEVTIVDGTIITNNSAGDKVSTSNNESMGGAIMLRSGATLNLRGGEIYKNNGGNSKGITWYDGIINISGNPRVGNDKNDDPIHRFTTTNNPNQVINIEGPLGLNASINIREHTTDRGRPDYTTGLTVIAQMGPGQGNANEYEAERFNYQGDKWDVIARDPGNDRDLILGIAPPPTKFALLRVPDTIHFGERPLLTTKLVGPYGDAPNASSVQADFNKGMANWDFGFEITNTRHNNWTLTLQAVPFTNDDGIIGANPVAVSKVAGNTTTEELILAPLRVITRRNEKGESIKWHWTQLDYKIEAQTALDTVIEDDFQSVFTWTLLVAPT